MSAPNTGVVAPTRLRDEYVTAEPLNWEAHLEALPLATWIIGQDTEVSLSQNQEILRGCEQVFLNQACRELLGFTSRDSPSVSSWHHYLHPEDRAACLVAWRDFIEGREPRFSTITRWIRPDTKEVISLAVRAQRLLCGDIQGWLRPTRAEQALSRLAELL